MELCCMVSETEIKQMETVTLMSPHLDVHDTSSRRNKCHHDPASPGNYLLFIMETVNNSAITIAIK
jgi:hypothetical protein